MSLPGFSVAGMHKLTTLDFPGVVSAIVFTQGCNFHCPYCHNPHLIPLAGKGPGLDVGEVLEFLRKRAGFLDGVVISGGEPCLHQSLPGLCRDIRALGYAVKLDSNGSRPEMLRSLLDEGLLDYVALDLKTGPEGYAALCREDTCAASLGLSLELVRRSGVAHELRSTCVAPFVSSAALPAMAALAADSPWYLQKANIGEAMRGKGLEALSQESIEALAREAVKLGADARIR